MALVKEKLPATLCDPCPIPQAPVEQKYFSHVETTTSQLNSVFSQMIHNMTSIKACLVWPTAEETV